MVNPFAEISEDSEYNGGEQKYSIKEIILRHIKKISDLSCKEFTGSYWEKRPIKTQGGIFFSEVYHEDVRQAYCNAIDFLMDVVYSMSDKSFKKIIDDEEECKDIVKKLKNKKNIFREMNKMFTRTNFWDENSSYIESPED